MKYLACSAFVAILTTLGLTTTAFGQWTVTNLHPSSPTASHSTQAYGAGGQQVGSVLSGVLGEGNRATLWTGSASSRVDLHPTGWASSVAFAARGGQQVGRGTFNATTFTAAILWKTLPIVQMAQLM